MKICLGSHTIASILSLAALLAAPTAFADEPPTLAWIRQFGTPRAEVFQHPAFDGFGNFFVSESKTYAFSGDEFRGEYLHKFDLAGNPLWTREVGTNTDTDSIAGMWADGSGSLYMSGYTSGNIGAANAGDLDAYLRKYDAAGNIIWSRQIGTAAHDSLSALIGDGRGNLYVSGITGGALAAPHMGESDAIVGKYDVDGNLLWMRQFGGPSWDDSIDVVPDGLGNVFLSGRTKSSLGGPNAGNYDAFLAKYDDAGNLVWFHQYGGPEYNSGGSLATDGHGTIYVGERHGGFWDSSHLSKYDNDGTRLWSRELGGTDNNDSWGVSAVDSRGNVYVSGSTSRSLGGPNAGSRDAFVRKYDSAGQILWTFQLGSTQAEDSNGTIAADALGNIVLVGHTGGDLAGPYAGGWGGGDAWVAVLRDSFPGDYNANGVIDAADHLVWKADFASTTALAADGNRNGIIDAADYVLWRNNSVSSTSSNSEALPTVPEPSAAVLGALALLHVVLRKRSIGSRCTQTSKGDDVQALRG